MVECYVACGVYIDSIFGGGVGSRDVWGEPGRKLVLDYFRFWVFFFFFPRRFVNLVLPLLLLRDIALSRRFSFFSFLFFAFKLIYYIFCGICLLFLLSLGSETRLAIVELRTAMGGKKMETRIALVGKVLLHVPR